MLIEFEIILTFLEFGLPTVGLSDAIPVAVSVLSAMLTVRVCGVFQHSVTEADFIWVGY